MRVGYCRVSTASGEQLSALENQIGRVTAAGVERVITDVESGLSSDRPGMNELLGLIDQRRITEVIATRVDRLGRDAAATDALIVLAGRRGVRITTLDGGEIETQTPTGFLMARLTTSLAEVESKMLSLRIRRGLEQRRLQKRPCRGRAPWGYQISADRSRFEPHPQHWPLAQDFIALLAKHNWRMNTALDRFPHPLPLSSCRAVKAWLVNPVLRGGIGYRQQKNHVFAEVIWDQHPPLIDPAQWHVIETQLQQNRRHWGANTTLTPKLLTSLCWCPNCGKRQCYAGSRTIPSVLCRTRTCESRYRGTRESVIVEALNQALAARASALAGHIEEESPEAATLRAQIARLEAMADPDLEPALLTKRQRLAQITAQQGPRPEIVAALADINAWTAATPEELRSVYLQFVERVETDRGQVLRVVLKL